MKKYIADLLTLMRLILAFLVPAAILLYAWPSATVMLIVAILTDAFDGMAARRWPYPKGEYHWWRKVEPDAVADGLLTFTVLVALALVSVAWAVVLLIVILGTIGFHVAIARTRRLSPKLSERIDVTYGWTYAATLAGVLVYLTVRATPEWPTWLTAYLAWSFVFVFIKWDRATSRY